MHEQIFFSAMKGMTDPEQKREAITQTFYKRVFRELVLKSKATVLLQGTILTDIEETAAGIKRQHNVFEQIGIDPQKAFGYKISEPLVELRKDGVRKVGMALGLQKSLFDRIPFPGPALAARVIGEVTPMKIALVRKATVIVEEELKKVKAFQYMAILHEDRVTGMRAGKRDFGLQIEIRCWDSIDARKATPTRLPWQTLERIAGKILERRARRGQRDLQPCHQAAFHDRSHLRRQGFRAVAGSTEKGQKAALPPFCPFFLRFRTVQFTGSKWGCSWLS